MIHGFRRGISGGVCAFAAALSLAAPESPAAPAIWEEVPSPTDRDLTDVHFVDDRHGWATGAFGTLLRSVDAGATWTEVNTPAGDSFVAVFGQSPDEAFIARGSLHRTLDGGSTWEEDIDGFSGRGASIFDIVFVSHEVGFLVQSGLVYRTADGGASWDNVSDYDGLFIDSIRVADSSTLYATGGITYIDIFGSRTEGNLARSRDGGASWQAVVLPEIDEIHSAVWFGAADGIVYTFSGAAYRTGDGGDSWELASAEMVDETGTPVGIVVDALVTRDGTVVGVTFDGAVLESADGLNWTRVADTGAPWSSLAQTPGGTLFAVGNGGTIWRRPAPAPAGLKVVALAFDGDNRVLAVTVEAVPGRVYRLDASGDLRGWEPQREMVAAGAAVVFELAVPSGDLSGFVRVVELDGAAEAP